MKTKQLGLILGSIFLVGLIVIVLILSLQNFGYIPAFGAITGGSGGFITVACTNPQYLSSIPQYSMQCTFLAVPNGQDAQITLDSATNQKLFGFGTENTGVFSMRSLVDGCKYSFSNVSYPVYQYTIKANDVSQSNGKWTCMANLANPSYGSANYQKNNNYPGEYIGTTPLVCDKPSCLVSAGGGASGCNAVWRKQAGVIYNIDPSSLFYDYQLNISMDLNSTSYSAVLSNINKSVYTDVFSCSSQLTGKGDQACPPPNTVASIFVANANSVNPLSYVDVNFAQSVINTNYQMVDINSILSNNNAYSINVNNMLASKPNIGQYASFYSTPATSYVTASVLVKPVSTVSIPLVTCGFNANKFVQHIPVGNPQIISLATQPANAANKASVIATTKNNGESATFLFTMKCPYDVQVFSTTANISAGTTVDVPIVYEGASFKGNCEVAVKDINNPQFVSYANTTLTLNPFCAVPKPWVGSQLVSTQYGCSYICPNYINGVDVIDPGCKTITSYDRCNYADVNGTKTCLSQASYNGIHCIKIGISTSTNNYMDKVLSGELLPFVPEQKDRKYFVVQTNNVPVCDYVNEFGYQNGVSIDLTYDPSVGFPESTDYISPAPVPGTTPPPTQTCPVGQILQSDDSCINPPVQVDQTPVTEDNQTVVQTPPSVTSTTPDYTLYYIASGIVIILGITGIGFILSKRRR